MPGLADDSSRDRYVDFLRAFAICVVVLGHWLITALVRRDGTIEAPELLAVAPWTQWLTLGFQIMPLFFLAGGYAAAGSWAGRHEPAAAWARARALRLLLPTAAYVALVLAAVAFAWWTASILQRSAWWAGPWRCSSGSCRFICC